MKLLDEYYDKKISESVKVFYKTEKGKELKNKLSESRLGIPLSEETKRKQSDKMKGVRPKILDVHPSARYWFFYNKENAPIISPSSSYAFNF